MNELYHHGILGQKWGIRRYQNPDGTLTTEGKKRYRINSSGKIVKLTRKERKLLAQKQAAAAAKKKPLREKAVSDMTDRELQKYITRMANERTALQLKADISRLNPKQVSMGEKLVKKALNDTIIPAMTNVGRQYLEQLGKEALKLNQKQEPTKEQKAKSDAQYWKNLSDIENNKANYNRTKELNDNYAKNKDISIYKNRK